MDDRIWCTIMYEKIFDGLIQKYGEDFNWRILPIENSFDAELKKEIQKDHFLFGKDIYALAKCDANDDVLYVMQMEGVDMFCIVHLTYTKQNEKGFPKYQMFENIEKVINYLEESIVL